MDTDSGFEFLDHPSDIGFRVTAGSLEDLFATCAEALISLIFDPTDIIDSEVVNLAASGIDQESLLVNWLNEVLYWVDSKRLAMRHFRVTFPGEARLIATAHAEPRNSQKHKPRLVVKAVTYHQLRILKEGSKWMAEVYVDV